MLNLHAEIKEFFQDVLLCLVPESIEFECFIFREERRQQKKALNLTENRGDRFCANFFIHFFYVLLFVVLSASSSLRNGELRERVCCKTMEPRQKGKHWVTTNIQQVEEA